MNLSVSPEKFSEQAPVVVDRQRLIEQADFLLPKIRRDLKRMDELNKDFLPEGIASKMLQRFQMGLRDEDLDDLSAIELEKLQALRDFYIQREGN
jgi:hypothetical protein